MLVYAGGYLIYTSPAFGPIGGSVVAGIGGVTVAGGAVTVVGGMHVTSGLLFHDQEIEEQAQQHEGISCRSA